jgi:UDP-N-acetylglucosamine acyltransferase
MTTHSIIDPGAQIGKNVEIGPFCYIEKDVIIGDNTVLEAHVSVFGGSRIGENCHIYPGAVIGAPAQDLNYAGEKTSVEIGDRVVIREHCTLHRGTKESWKTTVGDDCYLMAYVHIAHDCRVGDACILANAVNLGGHVEVGEKANIGGMVAVHQFSKIGKYAMIGGGVTVRKDVPPFVKAARDPVSYIGVNSIGLKRKGFDPDAIQQITDIYRLIFVKHRNLKKALLAIQEELPDSEYRSDVLKFIEDSRRGLIKGIR